MSEEEEDAGGDAVAMVTKISSSTAQCNSCSSSRFFQTQAVAELGTTTIINVPFSLLFSPPLTFSALLVMMPLPPLAWSGAQHSGSVIRLMIAMLEPAHVSARHYVD